MKLHVLKTGSAGNCYLLEAKDGTLIIEAGVRLVEIKKAINFDLRKIVGCIVSHSHLDHAKYAVSYGDNGIPVFCSTQTRAEIRADKHPLFQPISDKIKFSIGNFSILPVDLVHDVRNFGYLIKHWEMGLTCFITDTHYSPAVFPGMRNIILEANYSEHIIKERLAKGMIDHAYYERVRGSHLSLENAINFLEANDLKWVNNIVLIHLSDGNSDAAMFKSKVASATGKPVWIADKDMVIDLKDIF